MSNLGLFVVGSLVTLLVAASMALLIWGAVLDGRYNDARRADERARRVRATESASSTRRNHNTSTSGSRKGNKVLIRR